MLGSPTGVHHSAYRVSTLIDIMDKLQSKQAGLRIGDTLHNSFAYADDITLFSSTIPGLQSLIVTVTQELGDLNLVLQRVNACSLVINLNVSLHLLSGLWDTRLWNLLIIWIYLHGVNFTSNVKYDIHINTRVQKCKRSMYALSNCGMRYPGLSSSTKSHLFRSVCQPTLMYGVECLNVTSKNSNDLNSAQGSVIKHIYVVKIG